MQTACSLLHFGIPGWALNLEATGESNLHLKAVWFLSSLGWNLQVEISTCGLIYFS